MKKIALIEDDQFIQDFVSQRLIEAGYEVILCTDGDEALNLIEESQPDAVLLDLDLPNRNGMEILSDIRSLTSVQAIPVIIFSNNDDPDIESKAIAAGAQDFYMKASTDPQELIKKIEGLF